MSNINYESMIIQSLYKLAICETKTYNLTTSAELYFNYIIYLYNSYQYIYILLNLPTCDYYNTICPLGTLILI